MIEKKFINGYYYKLVHMIGGWTDPVSCVIKVKRCYYKHSKYVVLLKMIRCSSDSKYTIGSEMEWYVDWCFETKKLNNAEILAMKL